MDATEQKRAAGYFSSRLDKKLQAALVMPVTVVEAPAGYGKTTAIRHLEEMSQGLAEAFWFIAFGEDTGRGWERLCQTVTAISPATGSQMLALGHPNRVNSQQAVELLGQLRCERDTLLILDNFQNLSKELKDILVSAMFTLSCEHLHVIISTQYLRLPQDLEHSEQRVNKITTSDLLLGAEDIRSYYLSVGRKLDLSDSQEIFRRTEGWPVAVSLCLRADGDMCVLAENHRVDSLLAEVFFDNLSDKEKALLLPFALFDAMSDGQLCHILGKEESTRRTELLHRSPMIRYDQAAGVYYPHAIMQDFLKMRLESADAETRQTIYLRAGEWHAAHGNLCQAIACYHAVKAYEPILALPLVNLCLTKINGVSFETLAREMLVACPQTLWEAYPISLLRIAYFLFAGTDFSAYQLAMDKARLVVDKCGDKALRGEWLIMDALSVYPDLTAMGKRWEEASSLIAGRCRVIASEEPFLFGCQSIWYMFYTTPGAGKTTGQALEKALGFYNALTGGHAGGADVLYWGELACIRGDYEESQRLAYQAAQLSEDARQPTVTFGSALLLGRIAISRSDMAGLEAAIDYMENKAATYSFMQGSAMNAYMLDTARAMMRSMMEQTRQAPVWARKGVKREESLSLSTQMTRHAYISEILLIGDYNRAVGILEATLRLDKRLCNTVTEYYLHTGLALAYLGLLRRNKAIEELDKALAIGAPDEMVSIFVHHRRILSLLFINAQLQKKYGAFIAKIQGIKADFSGASYANLIGLCQQNLPDSLTERERDIARLAAQGLRNREIAQRECISEHTVKNHLKTIFSKLDIDRRAKLVDLLKP